MMTIYFIPVIVQLILLVLKLTGVILWSWWVVFIPLFVVGAFIAFIYVIDKTMYQ